MKRHGERHWWVMSPMMSYTEVILDDGTGPTYDVRDVVCVVAATKRAAVVAGVAKMKQWPQEARGDNKNPHAGVTAEPALCSHGFCGCDLLDCGLNPGLENQDYCEACAAEDEAREAAG